jgi:hypothetical protein
MFSNGLPLPLAGGSVSSDSDEVEVDDTPVALGVGAGAEGWAVGLGDEIADVGEPPATVDVTMVPVLMPVGSMTIGTTICSVLPSLSMVVLVIVVLTALVRSSSASSSWSSLSLVLVGSGATAVLEGGASRVVVVGSYVLETAAYASSTTSAGMVQPIASQYNSSGPRTSSRAQSSASHLETAHATALGRYEALLSLVWHMPERPSVHVATKCLRGQLTFSITAAVVYVTQAILPALRQAL